MSTLKIFIIIASTRPGCAGRKIADWLYELAKEQDPKIQFELVDLVDWKLPPLNEPIPAMQGIYQHDHTRQWSEKIAQADGYIIVTPEYNGGYPATLKNALDYLYHEWSGKPISFVGYGVYGAQSAVQQLRKVTDSLKMQTIPEQVAIVFHRDMFDKNHRWLDSDKSLSPNISSANTLLKAIELATKNKKINEVKKENSNMKSQTINTNNIG